MPTSYAKYIRCKILVSDSLLRKDFFSIDKGIHFLCARKFCRRPILRKSVPQSKVAARPRLNVLCWCTSEACKCSITSAVVMAVAMTSCSLRGLLALMQDQGCQIGHLMANFETFGHF